MNDLGFLGGGQLARMSILAAHRMGLRCVSLDPSEDSPASQVAPALVGQLADPQAVAALIRQSRRLTLENEFIPADALRDAFEMAGRDPTDLLPGIDTLATIQDKLLQREALLAAGVPSPEAGPLDPGVAWPGKAVVLKARFGGYDGKGTRYARTAEEWATNTDYLPAHGWLVEGFVPFVRELAVMVYRSPLATGAFPVMETVQTNHVCDLVFRAPESTPHERARKVAIAAVEAVNGFGLFGVELFEREDGEILVNEIAPRPHNTGHYTLDWGGVSQFEQHVRLTMGWTPDQPLGGGVCMANLLGIEHAGDVRVAIAAAVSEQGIFVHWYGKSEAKPGRKMGHVNAVGEDCVARAVAARQRFMDAWRPVTPSRLQ